MNQYEEWLRDALELPGEIRPKADKNKLVYLEPNDDVPGFDEQKTLQALGIKKVLFDMDSDDGTHGYSVPGQLAITRGTMFYTKTLWHELGHILCKHFERENTLAPELAEMEAESVAYLLCHIYGYKKGKSDSRAYIQGWGKGKPLPPESVPIVIAAVEKIREINSTL